MGLESLLTLLALNSLAKADHKREIKRRAARMDRWYREHGFDIQRQEEICKDLYERYPDVWLEMVKAGAAKPRLPLLYETDPDIERRFPPEWCRKLRWDMERFLCEREGVKYFRHEDWWHDPEYLKAWKFRFKY